MVEECTKEDFNQMLIEDMKAEESQYREDCNIECQLKKDYDYFKDYYASAFDNAIEALQELSRLHKTYNQEFDIRDLGDEL